jgi:hypothetical protein
MNLTLLSRISFLLAISGLILIYLFSPSQDIVKKSIAEVKKNCYGQVEIEGTIDRLSYSSEGSLIGELKQNKSKILIFLRDSLVEEGDNVSVLGKASKFSNQCWIFPDRVESR